MPLETLSTHGVIKGNSDSDRKETGKNTYDTARTGEEEDTQFVQAFLPL